MNAPNEIKPLRQEGPSRHEVWRMFDRIARKYDFLNHILSLNRDKSWRKRMANHLPDRSGLEILDLATGTGDQLLALYDSGKVKSGVGMDLASQMMAIAGDKISARGLTSALSLVRGDGVRMPFADNSFDIVSITYGIRNMPDVLQALCEMKRVLKPGGRALILEFSLPSRTTLRAMYLFYFRRILPLLGGFVSGDKEAYRYLNETVETFPYGDAFCRLMAEAGFARVASYPLTYGVSTIYRGDKL